jgi:hypothetical protein
MISENERLLLMGIYELCYNRVKDIDTLKALFYDLKASGVITIGNAEYDIQQTFDKYYEILDCYENDKNYQTTRDKLSRYINTLKSTLTYDRVA